MNINNTKLEDFLTFPGTIFDVRSPTEYKHARICGALNIPLFTDIERASVGTLYKQQGKEAAIELGMGFAGPRLVDYISFIKKNKVDGFAKMYCWRGGMRSHSMAWLLQTAGYPTITLTGGYKTFRRWVLSSLNQDLNLRVIGGLTGSGKTEVLQALMNLGEQVLDLESLASHRGSTFGNLNLPPQPSTEQFENEIAFSLKNIDPDKPLWIEDESRMIGKCKLPENLFNQIRKAPLYFLEVAHEKRVRRLRDSYGQLPPEILIEATQRLSKRLGGSRTQQIIKLIIHNMIDEAIGLTLEYYDSTYRYGISSRIQTIVPFKVNVPTPLQIAQQLIDSLTYQ